MDSTTRLGLQKPNPDPVTGDFVDISVLNSNADKIDSTISFTICTSTARPATPFQGQAILETDTGRTYLWGGSAWLPLLIGAKVQVDTNLGVGTAPNANSLRKIETLGSGTNGALSQVLLRQTGAAASSRALSTMGGGDTQDHWWVDFDGKMQWGPGNAGGDVTFSRSTSGTLDVSGKLTVNGIVPGTATMTIFSASGTYTKPAGAKSLRVRVVGGGGAGGGAAITAAGQCAIGAGGGGGGYAESVLDAASVTSTVAVTVGAGGAAGTAGANAGSSGGDSSFGSYLSAGGGAGGGGMVASTTTLIGGGVGGTATGGQVGIVGRIGGTGRVVTGIPIELGLGGDSVLGTGGQSALGSNGLSGRTGMGYGGGGSAGMNRDTGGSAARQGGTGSDGVVIVETFF